MKKIRVLVVEDSHTIRKYLVDVLAAAPDFEVVGEAADGEQAIRLCESLRPDVVTMDIVLPLMTGVEATEYIMAWCPTPIVIVSASINRGEALKTYDALAAGAVDLVDKPRISEPRAEWEAEFLARVRMVSRIRVITHPRGRLQGSARLPARVQLPQNAKPPAGSTAVATQLRAAGAGTIRAIAIGASTGGPAAVAEILKALPADFPIPLLIVIHVSDMFAFALAEWLNTQSNLPVRFAIEGQALPLPGQQPGALLAPAGAHLIVEAGLLRLVKTPERHSCRPSVDELFESVAAFLGSAAACVLLTGMGRDGAAGLLVARSAGCLTMAQDEASSIVFGMPGEAIRLNAASRVLALDQIGPALASLGVKAPIAGGSF
ncbi:MAG TPA: chemotaxis-specific protein-glutamate methyltransferase CheB [Acidobacteriaceae bacterium]|nr:chemotaxis-specific protein-glutamate methyltransferase CheB [Acidobacteriaceae bacterium]